MGYPKNVFRIGYLAQDFIEIAMENYIEYKNINSKLKSKDNFEQIYDLEFLGKKESVIITFCTMAIESFLNDYAAACLNDELYYNSYDSLSIQSKFQLIVQFILHKEFSRDKEPFGLLSKLIKKRNALVHNKSIDACSMPCKLEDLSKKSNNNISSMYNNYLNDKYNVVTDAIRAVVQLINYFELNDLESSACERMFAKYTLCIVENEPESEELKILKDLGLDIKRIKNNCKKLPF